MYKYLHSFFAICYYFFTQVLWAWFLIAVITLIENNDRANEILFSKNTKPVVTTPSFEFNFGDIWSVIIIIITLIIVFTIFAFLIIKLPKEAKKTTQFVTQKPAIFIAEKITHKKVVNSKSTFMLSQRIVWLIKIVLCVIPFTALFFAPSNEYLSQETYVNALTLLAIPSFLFLLLHYATHFYIKK